MHLGGDVLRVIRADVQSVGDVSREAMEVLAERCPQRDRRADGRADDRADAAAAGTDAETPPRLGPAAVRLIRLPLPLPSS